MRHEFDIQIGEIGARGDGIAILEDGKRVYVPLTVPGERVRVRLGQARPDGFAGRLVEILAEGPGRGQPACRHFGMCGGCALQHLSPQYYHEWKVALLAKALARQGISSDNVRPLYVTPVGSRRRADFAAVRRKNDVVLGFHARLSHNVVDLAECPVLHPEIVKILGPLRDLLGALLDPSDNAEIAVAKTESGVDLLLTTGAALGLKRRERLAAFAHAHDLARISRRHPKARGTEPLIERRPVRVTFGGVAVNLPPGAFLQASAEGEAALQSAVREGVGTSRRIADLYAGCGTFSLPLAAEGRAVHAIEGDGRLIEALDGAIRSTAGRLRLNVTERDLDRRPLRPEELQGTEAVIFDPPRAGARAQAEMLAASDVPCAVAISCNPASFARDARILIDGGFALQWTQPVDQFLWSPHLELVATFTR